MTELRKIEEEAYEDCIVLAEYAFQRELPEEDREKWIERLHKQDIWGIFEEDALCSKLHVLDLDVCIAGQSFKMGGIAGVATYPEYRRTGQAGQLMTQAVRSMKEKGQVVSYLHPFNVPFYRKYGWEIIASEKKYTIEQKDLVFDQKPDGRVIRLDKEVALDVIPELYDDYCQLYNGMLERTDEWWEDDIFHTEFEVALYVTEAGEPEGYLLYEIDDHEMNIDEYVHLSDEARRGLWNFICQHDSMVDKVTIHVPEDDGLFYTIANPKIEQEVHPYFMGRIIDVAAFLEQYPFQLSQEIKLYVTDDFCSWNEGTYRISTEGVTYKKEQDTDALSLDISTLSALLIGYREVSFFYKYGKIIGEKEKVEQLQQSISSNTTFFPDYF